MKKLKDYKTLGCHFTVYDEGIEIHKMTSDRFIKRSDIADVTIKKFSSSVSFRIANTKEDVTLLFSGKDMQSKEHVRVGEYLQGKTTDEVFQTQTPANKISETRDSTTIDSKKEDVTKPQLVVGGIIILVTGFIILSIFNGSDTTPATSQIDTVKTDQPAKEPIIQIMTLYDIPMSKLSEQFATPLNSVGNLIVDTDEYKLLIESKDGVNSDYVEVQLKSLGSCTKSGVTPNSDESLQLVGLKSHLKGNPTNPPAGVANGAIEYCDYPSEKFSVGTSCMHDGGNYDVSLSPRTYCDN